MNLRVITAFAEYAIGDTITDAKAIADILASDAVAFVVKVAADVEQAAEKVAKA